MSSPLDAAEILNREFLEVRARLLQVAAVLDRLDRAHGDLSADPRRQNIDRALDLLAEHRADRAEQLQLLFSLPYDPAWKQTMGLAP